MSTDEELTEPVMDGATDATDAAKAAGLAEQAQHDHPDSATDLVRDLQQRAHETGVSSRDGRPSSSDTAAPR